MDRELIFQGIKKCLRECIRVDEDEITLQARIIDDLGADSLDLLDIIFSMERHFKVKIQQGGIEQRAREGIPPEEFEVNGKLRPRAVERLRQILPEVSPEELKEGMHLGRIPYLFTVATFVGIVEDCLARQGKQ